MYLRKDLCLLMKGLLLRTPEERLEQVIAGRLIVPVFQLIVSLRDGKTLGFEALSRGEGTCRFFT